jgi:hypothetical protein
LRDWSLDEFKAAASHLARSCQFMPKPYDFEQLRRAHGTSASEAWAVVLKSCVDWRNPERLPQGRIARAAQVVGGFHAIAFADAQRELPWLAKRFREAFEELTEVETAREALPQLTPSANELALARDAVRALAAPSR